MYNNSVTMNGANLMTTPGMISATGVSGIVEGSSFPPEQNRKEDAPFGPACKVTISEEGRALSRQQSAGPEKEASGAENARAEKLMHRLSQAEEDAKDTNDGIRKELYELDQRILALNSSSVGKADINNDPVAKEAQEQLLKLREALKKLREYQLEESQRLAREAGLAGRKSGRYQDEIDKNNRELLTLLKTIEEAEKAKRQRTDDTTEAEEDGGGQRTDSAGNSSFRDAATHFMTSTVKQESAIEDLSAGLKDTANWLIDTANSVARNVLEKSSGIRAAMEDGRFSDEEIAGMMDELRESMPTAAQNVESYRGFGLYLLNELRTEKINHSGDHPMRNVQKAKEAALQATAAETLGAAGQGALDQTSDELADEVKELIERRNDPDRAAGEEKKEEEEKLLKSL